MSQFIYDNDLPPPQSKALAFTSPVFKQRTAIAWFGLALAVFSSGCANNSSIHPQNIAKQTFNSDDPCSDNARNIGVAIGTIGGTILGSLVGGKGNKTLATLTGGLAGAAIGGLIGHDLDRRRCELSKIAKANNLDILMTDINLPVDATENKGSVRTTDQRVGMSVTITDHGAQFNTGSATPTTQTAKAFAEIAERYRIDTSPSTSAQTKEVIAARNGKIRLLLVGHTDDTGPSRLNADLSEARARAIAKIFATKGFTPDQIFYQGAGESLPIADNRTEAGRQTNRRVEIIDLSNEEAFTAFLSSRKPNIAFYRPAEKEYPASQQKAKATKETRETGAPPKASNSEKKPHPYEGKITPADPSVIKLKPSEKTTPSKATMPPPAIIGERPKATSSQEPPATIDFGGAPADNNFTQVDIGKMSHSSVLSIISSAYASSDSPVGSCAQDRPRATNGVKSLRSDKLLELSTTDYVPGLYNTSWSGKVNGHLVALTNVAVLRDGGAPARKPNLLVFRDYNGGANIAPNYRGAPEVNTYQGDKALLYRIFSDGPIRCIDVVIPNRSNTAPNSNLIYTHRGQLYQVGFAPSISR